MRGWAAPVNSSLLNHHCVCVVSPQQLCLTVREREREREVMNAGSVRLLESSAGLAEPDCYNFS